ncbi:ribonuclease P protein component [Marinicella sp. W31]|uniref:ribonuclease P protein component n=1 Tax=Marinicella sp. W31 TaxID=3023713 RepID=UPI0037575569
MPDAPRAERDYQPDHLIVTVASMNAPQKFPKSKRLLTRFDYNRVFNKSRRVGSQHFLLIYHLNKQSEARLGIIVSKKVDKRAVVRNHIKRLIRESFRLHSGLNGGEYVVMARPGRKLERIGNQQIRDELDELWARVNAILNGMRKT